jgi:hypothetical protein
LRAQGKIVLCVASSGIAALLLIGGRTAHSVFKIPIPVHDQSLCNFTKNSLIADLIRATDLIIWDEVPMQDKFAVHAVDRSCKDARDDPRPFGGIPIVFGGDFQQILPVILKGSRAAIVNASLLKSYLWKHVHVLHLKTNMRVGHDPANRQFADWLLDVGHGRSNVTAADGTIKLPDEMKCASMAHLIDSIYSDVATPQPPGYFTD